VVLAGTPAAAGLYTFRVLLPAGLKVMPHTHPDDRMYTVLEGSFTIGLGTEFDATRLQTLTPGDVYFLPAGTPHFHWANAGATVAEVTGVGPTATAYIHIEDDPRRH
jgi:quercetin dioxygenase-like cupin family protein